MIPSGGATGQELMRLQQLGSQYRQMMRQLANKSANDPRASAVLKKALRLAEDAAETIAQYMVNG